MGNGAQIRGPNRVGSGVMDEGDLTRRVVHAYASVTDEESRALGQAAAAAVLPLRRRLWALAERMVPERLAAALRARSAPTDPTGRDGVRELRLAIADWLDPPPVCRWCRRAMRQGEAGVRECVSARKPARAREVALAADDRVLEYRTAARAWTPRGPLKCRPARPLSARLPGGAVARCGTLALYPAGSIDLATMAAALAVPRGAASGYDVAADRDCKALLAATCPAALLPYPVEAVERWSDEAVWRLYAAVAEASGARGGLAGALPRSLLNARKALQRARNEHARVNGRIAVGIQRRYASPNATVTRADLVQGAAIGNDRAVLDYDAAQARYTTYGANWARQGVGEAFSQRDLVGSPPWLLDLRRAVDGRLLAGGGCSPLDSDRPPTAADLLKAIEALCEAAARIATPGHGRRPEVLALVWAMADDLAGVLGIDGDDGTGLGLLALCPAVVAAAPPYALAAIDAPASVVHKRLRAGIRGARPKPPCLGGSKPKPPEDPERARERVAAALVALLSLKRASGPGLLAALRHGAPVLVQIGAGGDDDEDAQGTEGAGGDTRRAAVLEAPDDAETLAAENDDRVRWQAVLGGLAALRAQGPRGAEAAEVVRRHHGLDHVGEDGTQTASGPVGESFAGIGAAGLRAGLPPGAPPRVLTKEAVRKTYQRAIQALQDIARGLMPDWASEEAERDDATAPLAPHALAARPWPLTPPETPRPVALAAAPPSPREAGDGGAWDAFRDAAAGVAW
jgi:hypothetical protein